MFDKPLHYTQLKCEDFTSLADKTYPDYRTIFKTRTVDKKPYLIYLEQFGADYYFLKFHPSKHKTNPNKYKLRTGNKTLPIKILSTCLAIAVDKMKKCPDICIGIYGQWDEKDVETQKEISQRYNMWLRIAVSKIDPGKYEFVRDEGYNFFMIIPAGKYNEEYHSKIQNYFVKRFKSKLDELPVPTIEEFKAYKFETGR